MRSRIVVVGSCVALALALTKAPARAADCSATQSACIDDDTLWPHAGPTRFVAVGSAETTAGGQLGFGLVASYLSRPIVLHLASPGASQGSQHNAVDDQVNGTFLWSYGVTDRLALDLALPLTLGQGGTGLAPVTGGQGLKDTAVRDLRFGFAYGIARRARRAIDMAPDSMQASQNTWGLVARLEIVAPTGDKQQFAGDGSGGFVPSLAGDGRLGHLFFGAEVGVRIRPTSDLLGARVGTQFVAAMGVGYDVLPRELLGIALEAWALPTFAEQETLTMVDGARVATPNGGHIAPAEWQLSVRSAPLRGGDLSLQLGGGGGIPLSGELPITTPRFRFTLGVRWAPRGRLP
ncbi:MAG: hypothetical protein M3O46_02065 [Myxococcota bacterium]|nr:hypothetical protein [Myxococcota bacterium]